MAEITAAGCPVTVRLSSGETYTEYVPMLRALSPADVDEKFRQLATVAIRGDQADQLMETVHQLDALRDVSSLVPLLTRQ